MHSQALPLRHASGGIVLPIAAYLLALAISMAGLHASGQPAAGLSGPDEPSHFLNAYFIHRWLWGEFGLHPLTAAVDFYVHYPKLAIGHWPPLHYAILAALFQVVPATPAVALLLNVALSTLPVLFVFAVTRRLAGTPAALAASAWYALLPLVVQSQALLMTDLAVAAWACAATAAWVAHARHPGLGRALLFAGLCVAAVLTKGSGWLLALVPPLHVAMTGRWRLLVDWRLLAAAVAAAAVLAPWYMLTSRITAGGWAFEPGLDYALRALSANLLTIARNVGPAGVLLALYEAAMAARGRDRDPARRDWVAACVALILATLALHALVPASIESRFMAPAMPAAATLAVLGLARLLQAVPATRRAPVGAVAAILLLAPAAHALHTLSPRPDLRAAEAAALVAANMGPAPAIWVVDADPGGEGAVTAEVAVRDTGRALHVARGSQLLSTSDWNGRGYRALAGDEAATLTRLRALGTRGVVIVRRDGVETPAHGTLLERALASDASGFRLVERLPHRHHAGRTEVWMVREPVRANLDRLRETSFPSKAKSLGAAGQAVPPSSSPSPTR